MFPLDGKVLISLNLILAMEPGTDNIFTLDLCFQMYLRPNIYRLRKIEKVSKTNQSMKSQIA